MANPSDDRMATLTKERQQLELKKLQADAGLLSERDVTLTVERMDWMYPNPVNDQKEKDEAHLLGKPVEDLSTNRRRLGENGDGYPGGSLFLKSLTKTSEDTLRKLREDPLMAIRQAEHRQQQINRQADPLIQYEVSGSERERPPYLPVPAPQAQPPVDVSEDARSRPHAGKGKRVYTAAAKPQAGETSNSDSIGPPAAMVSSRLEEMRQMGRVKTPRRAADRLEKYSGVKLREDEIEDERPTMRTSRASTLRSEPDEGGNRSELIRSMLNDGKRHEREKQERFEDAKRRQKMIDVVDDHLRERSHGVGVLAKENKKIYLDATLDVADRLKRKAHTRARDLENPLEG